MSKIHIVDTVEGTLDSYDVEDFCKLWKSMTKKNHMLHLELFREIQNG